MKTCRICNIEKELEEFPKNSCSKDGHKNQCNQCVALKGKEYRKTYKETNQLNLNKVSIKTCRQCKLEKNFDDFFKDSSRKDGLGNLCKKCDQERKNKYLDMHPEKKAESIQRFNDWAKNNPERNKISKKNWRINNQAHINEVAKSWKQNNKIKVAAQQRKDHLKAFYGLSLEQLNQMFLDQDNKCAICKNTFDKGVFKYHIDHDHATGKVRKLLCQQCNLGLGRFYDSIDNINRAIEYINFYNNIVVVQKGDQS